MVECLTPADVPIDETRYLCMSEGVERCAVLNATGAFHTLQSRAYSDLRRHVLDAGGEELLHNGSMWAASCQCMSHDDFQTASLDTKKQAVFGSGCDYSVPESGAPRCILHLDMATIGMRPTSGNRDEL